MECQKGYLKIHVAVDIRKNKIVSLDVTSEEVYDGSRLKKLGDNASYNNNGVKRVIADGAYDSNDNCRYLYDNGIEAAIKIRNNSWYDRSMGWRYSRKIVILQQLTNFENWKDSVSYGYRWWQKQYFLS